MDDDSSSLALFADVEKRIIAIRNSEVIIDRDVAELYGVRTKEVNQAVKNNPEKFPLGYILYLNSEEKSEVVKNFDHLSVVKYSNTLPTAFTEKGLYMLATILKSPQATKATIAIVETFTKIRELSSLVSKLPDTRTEAEQRSLMQRSSELLGEVMRDNAFEVTGDETTLEVNLAVMKIRHTVKREKKNEGEGA